MENFKLFYPDLTYCKSPYEACENADICILVTEWNEFRQLDFNHLTKVMTGRAFLDCRNVYSFEHLRGVDFAYDCFGRIDRGDGS